MRLERRDQSLDILSEGWFAARNGHSPDASLTDFPDQVEVVRGRKFTPKRSVRLEQLGILALARASHQFAFDERTHPAAEVAQVGQLQRDEEWPPSAAVLVQV